LSRKTLTKEAAPTANPGEDGTRWHRVEDTHLQGVAGEVGPAAETEFVYDVRAVGLNGLDA